VCLVWPVALVLHAQFCRDFGCTVEQWHVLRPEDCLILDSGEQLLLWCVTDVGINDATCNRCLAPVIPGVPNTDSEGVQGFVSPSYTTIW